MKNKGQYYWHAFNAAGKVARFQADEVVIVDGALVARTAMVEGGPMQNRLILAPGAWVSCYAASCIDGSAVALDDPLSDDHSIFLGTRAGKGGSRK